jgi:NAD(P)-dependent dehydrogenase (short-subunit alcohol dehydrogenase family)
MTEISRVYVITGADSGLGFTLAQELKKKGTVITCGIGDDLDVKADLSSVEGRSKFIDEIKARSGGYIDGLALVAGIDSASALTVQLNYFGTIEVLKGLRALLASADQPSVVVVTSSSTLNKGSKALVKACLSGDEQRAINCSNRLVRLGFGSKIYRSTKMALNQIVRKWSIRPDWAGSGIVLNAVAPGVIDTEVVLKNWHTHGELFKASLPQPLGSPGPVAAIVGLIAFLLSSENRFTTGQIIYADGGTDALRRSDKPLKIYLKYTLKELIRLVKLAKKQ